MSNPAAQSPLAEVLRDLHFDQADGVLTVRAEDRVWQMYLDRGAVFYCKVDAPDQRLDVLLVKWGLVQDGQVVLVIRDMIAYSDGLDRYTPGESLVPAHLRRHCFT